MRKFSSYGQIDTDLQYHAPRTALIDHAYTQLLGENPEKVDITSQCGRRARRANHRSCWKR